VIGLEPRHSIFDLFDKPVVLVANPALDTSYQRHQADLLVANNRVAVIYRSPQLSDQGCQHFVAHRNLLFHTQNSEPTGVRVPSVPSSLARWPNR